MAQKQQGTGPDNAGMNRDMDRHQQGGASGGQSNQSQQSTGPDRDKSRDADQQIDRDQQR
ncbi:hypothetical protein [Rubellimicrobium roseum]|uniref:Uncharacterized protein n=1 Tax=Rubellimicrobium roseum TaxID=687525 RepID=A0A5C4NMF0_9RHOB|nr:hypothetical protein [Rubellimicrobium roseum]TNC73867.1 hypothetical protein FHG71_05200 [Rubellimicrobium roseum]